MNSLHPPHPCPPLNLDARTHPLERKKSRLASRRLALGHLFLGGGLGNGGIRRRKLRLGNHGLVESHPLAYARKSVVIGEVEL